MNWTPYALALAAGIAAAFLLPWLFRGLAAFHGRLGFPEARQLLPRIFRAFGWMGAGAAVAGLAAQPFLPASQRVAAFTGAVLGAAVAWSLWRAARREGRR